MKYVLNPSESINETLSKCIPGDIIYLNCGIYNEKVEIFTDNITIIGENRDNVIISNKDYYHKILADYNECNTFRSYTCFVGGNNVTLSNLTIRNESVPSIKYGQAVALHADSDNFKCTNVYLDSAQDTLFTGPLPPDLIIRHQGFLKEPFLKGNPCKQIYENCKIRGNVDFIFGCAQALFINCDIVSREQETDRKKYIGFIAAPAHSQEMEYGYVFYKCNLIKESGAYGVYLARPWRDYGTAAFIDCKLDDHINPLGFNKWGNTERNKTARFYEYTENVDLSKREPWVKIFNKDEALEYIKNFYNFMNYEEK